MKTPHIKGWEYSKCSFKGKGYSYEFLYLKKDTFQINNPLMKIKILEK
jgi:hypothetical protein